MKYNAFKTIHEEGNTRYLLGNLEDSAMLLRFDTFDRHRSITKKFFRIKDTVIDTVLTSKTLALNSAVLYMIMRAAVEAPTSVYDDGTHKEDRFTPWDSATFAKIKKDFRDVVNASPKSHYKVDVESGNSVARAYHLQGYKYLVTELHDSLSRTYWLCRLSVLGDLHIVAVRDYGRGDHKITTNAECFVLSRALIATLLNLLDINVEKDGGDLNAEGER